MENILKKNKSNTKISLGIDTSSREGEDVVAIKETVQVIDSNKKNTKIVV